MKKKEKSLCESCKNELHIEYLESPSKFGRNTGLQIKGNEIMNYNCPCIYFNSRRESSLSNMIVIKCNQYFK